MSIGSRIKKLRKELELTQTEFASRIGSVQNTVTGYESGRRNPSSPVISLICREFGVSESWLRTGEGEMFIEETPDEKFMRVAKAIASSDSKSDQMIRRTLLYFFEMDEAGKETLMNFIENIAGISEPSRPRFHSEAPTEEELLKSGMVLDEEEDAG